MDWLNRVPGRQRAAAGLEWTLWRRLPAILAWGSALPLAVLALRWFTTPSDRTPAQERELLLDAYRLLGAVGLHWSLVLALAIGCVIVMVMKGPAYSADSYPLPGAAGAAGDGTQDSSAQRR
jgi:hypothetical protein